MSNNKDEIKSAIYNRLVNYDNKNFISVELLDHLGMYNKTVDMIMDTCKQKMDNIILSSPLFQKPEYKITLSANIHRINEFVDDDTLSMGGEIKQLEDITIGYIMDILDKLAEDIRKQCFTNNDDKCFNINLNVHVEYLNDKEDQGDKDNE